MVQSPLAHFQGNTSALGNTKKKDTLILKGRTEMQVCVK